MPEPAKIVFFGTSEFAVPSLKALAARPEFCRVTLVVSQPDKPVGRQQRMTAPPVAAAARELGLPLFQPAKLRDGSAAARVAEERPDVFVVAAYGKILPKNLLDIPAKGPLNLHGSILPRFRGASPIQAAILAGERETGVTLMVMDEDIDHGPTVASTRVLLTETETHATLEVRLGDAAAKLIAESLPAYIAGSLKPVPQDHAAATFTKIINKEDGFINWRDESAQEIERKVRAYDPWPGAYAVWPKNGKEVRVLVQEAAVATEDAPGEPGRVSITASGFPAVSTKTGALELRTLQIEGRQPLRGDVFLRGYQAFPGSVLTSSTGAAKDAA